MAPCVPLSFRPVATSLHTFQSIPSFDTTSFPTGPASAPRKAYAPDKHTRD